MTTSNRYLAHDWFDRPLPDSIQIGSGSWLYSSFAFLHCISRMNPAVLIGSHTGIYNGTHFELGPYGAVDIGDFCSIVGAIIVTNRHVRIDGYVFIAHEVVIADHPFARPFDTRSDADTASTGDGVWIGENAWIGARAILLGSARIGEGAIVGAGTVVTEDVPPFAIAAGNPARIVGWARPKAGR